MEWNGAPYIDTLGIPCWSESPMAIVFLVADYSINATMICYASESSLTLRYASSVKVDAGLPLFWCL